MLHTSRRVIALVGLLVAASSASAQRPLNLDFEQSSAAYADRPWGWSLGWSAFAGGSGVTFTLDSAVHRSGARSLRIASSDTASAEQTIQLQLPADFARGRDVTLTAWSRSSTVRRRAAVALEAWGDRVVAAGDSATVPATTGDGWTQHTLRIRVPADPAIHSVVVSLSLEGAGTVWFDGFALRVNGTALTELPSTVNAPAAADLAWLRTQTLPLQRVGIAAGGGVRADEDLRLLADIIGPSRIVALGESTHGTGEFFVLKHRVLEYLVREHRFRVFAIEANQLATERVNRYVQFGEGTAATAMRAMFRLWNTEEMLELIEWMHDWNQSHPRDMVRFAGYDMQDHRTPVDTLRALLRRIEPSLLPLLDTLTSGYRGQAASATPQIDDTVRVRWATQGDSLWRMVAGRRSAWLASARTRPDTLAIEWGVQSATLFRQAARFNVSLFSPERDSLMATNLDWLLRTITPGARAVVWAHDVHVSHGGDPALSFNGGAQMGAWLRKRYGQEYRAFTLQTYEGEYSGARSFSDHTIVPVTAWPAPAGSMEAALHGLERPPRAVGWTVDLRGAGRAPGGTWLMQPRPVRHIGYAIYDYGFELRAVLPLEYDGILFVDRTTPPRMMP